jgi:glyceraldehyde 3-phosphate dehydrogenase
MMQSVGMNGAGRFGQHLLKNWLESGDINNISIDYIHDYNLHTRQIVEILLTDEYLGDFFKKKIVSHTQNSITFKKILSGVHTITCRTGSTIPWIGTPKLHLETSGRHADSASTRNFITQNTKHVVISATAPEADKTLLFGFNHEQFSVNDRVISYGSCTVNAYVCLANFINDKYGVVSSDANIIHNTPKHLWTSELISKRQCTLEQAAPRYLSFLNPENFAVNYTLIPFTGVSVIDYRFELHKPVSVQKIIADFKEATTRGVLHGLYDIEKQSKGANEYKFTKFSAVLLQENIRVIGKNLYMSAFFDNENSAVRYLDLVNFIAGKLTDVPT